jgi:hypothetical protein
MTHFQCIYATGLIIFLSVSGVNGQNLNFPGAAPSLSLSAVISEKLDINWLAASKIRWGSQLINETYFPQEVLEIYSQALLSYKLSNYWQVSSGYGYQRNNPFNGNWRNEHRLVQQVLYSIPFGKDKFLNRLRFEERWFSYPDTLNEFGTRARFQFGYIKQLRGNMVYWQINNEIYATTSGPRNAIISENWIYSGVGFSIKSIGHFETGVGLNSVVRNKKREWNNLLLLQVAWSYVIAKKRKEEMHPAIHSRHF